MKKLCPIHHYYYSGSICPLCANEKYARMMERHQKEESLKVEKKTEEITSDMLSMLKDKFSHNGKKK